MNTWTTVYILYFLISIAIIHLMARILSRTSTTYLLAAFPGDDGLASLVGRIIIGSFFLANVGFVIANLPPYMDNVTAGHAIAIVLDKLGSALLFVGFTLFLGLWIITKIRRFGANASTTR